MISPATISAVLSAANIIDVIGAHVQLKRNGANHTGLCPFHNEKSPSFSVSAAKQIYKCFGCGEGGNAIQFLIKHDKLTFPEAIKQLADKYNIAVEEDTQYQLPQETKNKKEEMAHLLQWAAQQYEQLLQSISADHPAKQYLASRGYTPERISEWGMGYAPANFKYLTENIISQNKYTIAAELGLVKSKEGKTYDFYHNRIIVPIHDHNGNLTGFAARQIPTGSEEDKKYPKWINPPNSLLYQKNKTWYGLHTAVQTIHREKMAYLVEGYPDVHTMQDNGITNTIAPCGKEITDEQIQMLKRYTQHICFVPNIDDNQSGQNAVLKQIDRFAAAGFKLSLIELPTCNDADEYINHILLTQKMKAA